MLVCQGLVTVFTPQLMVGTYLCSYHIVCSIIGFLESIAIAEAIAKKHDYKIDSNQELIGLGSANLVGSFFQAYPTTGAPLLLLYYMVHGVDVCGQIIMRLSAKRGNVQPGLAANFLVFQGQANYPSCRRILTDCDQQRGWGPDAAGKHNFCIHHHVDTLSAHPPFPLPTQVCTGRDRGLCRLVFS